MKMFVLYGQSKIELGEPKIVQDDKRLEPIIELHILMMLSCAPMLTRDKPTPSTKVRM